MNYVAIIPVRGGSKGIPRKNVKKFYKNRSLTELTILSAIEVRGISEIIVSSDDDEIIKHIIDYDVTVIKRPANLALDKTPTVDVINYLIDELSIDPNTWIFTLQVTSPFREPNILNKVIKINNLQKSRSSFIGITEIKEHPFWSFHLDDNTRLKPFYQPHGMPLRRQDLPILYRPNGAFFLSNAGQLSSDKNFYTENTRGFNMDAISSIDIDDQTDWDVAQLMASKIITWC